MLGQEPSATSNRRSRRDRRPDQAMASVSASAPRVAGVRAAAVRIRQREIHRRLGDCASDPEERARHLALGVDLPDDAAAAVVEGGARTAFARGSPSAAADLAFHAGAPRRRRRGCRAPPPCPRGGRRLVRRRRDVARHGAPGGPPGAGPGPGVTAPSCLLAASPPPFVRRRHRGQRHGLQRGTRRGRRRRRAPGGSRKGSPGA